MKKLIALILLVVLGLCAIPALATTPTIIGFTVRHDTNGNPNTFDLSVCLYVDDIVLVGGAAQTVTVPTGATCVNFAASGIFYANFTTTATVPASNITGGSGSIISPGCRYLNGLTSFSIIAPANCVVSLEWYR